MLRLLAQLGATLFIIVLAGVLVFYTIWGYFAWQWIQPASIRSFLLFMVVWIGLCWLTSLFLRLLFRVMQAYFPKIFRYFQEQEMEHRKTPPE